MERDRVSTTLGQEQAQPSPNSVTFADSSKAYRALVLPAVLALVLAPTANIQISNLYNSYSETNLQIRRRRGEMSGDYLEFHSGWNVPDWENARVPRLETVAHIHAAFKFNGNLKWLPYNQGA